MAYKVAEDSLPTELTDPNFVGSQNANSKLLRGYFLIQNQC